MRLLEQAELDLVFGAGSTCCCPHDRRKGNNGFGNGADADRAAPGGSGKTGGGKEGSFGGSRGER
ncbi:hypothetical protein [Novosphingobium sp.]|uniref:hypothetical protein n=1 Tax=Novosphingobium sp. TaxID=1874826 RepID=UPI0022C30DCC|nr:hypothetical protein [Novosphingobium sp.]MCZ8017762.1 hypothetical protein [Novosphingobium sp.]MCZ8033714.1 hypothetical protein [Novosphingobium sp.]MCZ8051070.1 hypothetical protein [Novosphingobium sp.]MCZ8059416.1 hypothetical protein [Novosphingobium sp.]MCZ8231254.1 hypothetical protein [Novosphingobium sp.]